MSEVIWLLCRDCIEKVLEVCKWFFSEVHGLTKESVMRGYWKRIVHLHWLCGVLSFALVGCSPANDKDEPLAGSISSVNHTTQGINWFEVNGYRASGGGGSECCIVMPATWRPGLKATIEWEVDPDPYGYVNWPKDTDGYRAAVERHRGNYRHYSEVVDISEWKGTERCGLTVHFLVCNQIKVTTSCWGYGSPNNPIKEPRNMKEPAVCPK
jgi:hypothetical protein